MIKIYQLIIRHLHKTIKQTGIYKQNKGGTSSRFTVYPSTCSLHVYTCLRKHFTPANHW